ncbi:uncharacterized protein A1O5_12188 [Cladophialophora psammophila CBS 110553]|uniref:F-box domain-containing protein n=1 Tax=Cladophialophora psammophila CBS 110553 TaxID=1182543 RepID=W9VU91_9EURO|nr:uncharacterized protein A1O5_12188 [Cladophialophora psammophila CBS 110553]EXJ59307.1 hypothetical protein A1O5_12188 [Cladophialophora psammophila CBS 110553]
MAFNSLVDASDTVLSDPPTELDDMDFEIEQNFDKMTLAWPLPREGLKRKSISRSIISDDSMSDTTGVEDNWSLSKKPRLSLHVHSKFESVPTEILNEVVSFLHDDQDLFNLTCACKTFANALIPPESAAWRQRFNSVFDWPFIDHSTEFAPAYQLRKFVLKHFTEFTDPDDERLLVQLEVVRDMVLEAYHQPQKHLPLPSTSPNLAAFASPHDSPWMRMFLSCPFFPSRNQRYGQAHPLFDSLQLTLSHLLLSPASQMAHTVRSSRTNYDLAVVYDWGQPLSLLYRKLTHKIAASVMSKARGKPSNLRSRRRLPRKPTKPTHELDTFALLHIRNFWHRHLIETGKGFGSTDMAENTYAKMAKELMRHGITPKKWERPLKENSLLQIPTEWYGHYSTLANWPRKRQQLEEVQSLAEDWQDVDPMKLDFAISTDNNVDGFWAPIFKGIPAFQKTMPELTSSQCIFIRGLAYFVQISSPSNVRRSSDPVSHATLTLPAVSRLPKYHPYLGLRLRGVIHSIPAQPQPTEDLDTDYSIPGFNRLVMMLYKPSKRYLIQVLEHAEEEYGDTFTTALTTQMIQNNAAAGAGTATTLDPVEIDAGLDNYLRSKLLSNPLWCDGSKLDKVAIEEMEERFRLSEYLDWNDIEYAYAYEGILNPGGKIMMGRWWRVALLGDGDGMEWSDSLGLWDDEDENTMDLDGAGSEQGQNEAENSPAETGGAGQTSGANGNGNGNSTTTTTTTTTTTGDGRHQKRERGPFIFWC